mmetsp:Transcript_30728/g.34399  ORF Transcript_30728/g.34399 Transcript_30728/m.34399 type:complete len:939 (-) Transcript_30728:336-3152(-)
MIFSDFRFGEAGCFLLAFILPVSNIITTVNNNIYNYGYKYRHKHKKKHKLLNRISNHILRKNHHRSTLEVKKKIEVRKKKNRVPLRRPNTSIDLLRDILLLLFAWNNRPKKKKHRVPLLTTNSLLVLLPLPKKRLKNHRPTIELLLLLLRVRPTNRLRLTIHSILREVLRVRLLSTIELLLLLRVLLRPTISRVLLLLLTTNSLRILLLLRLTMTSYAVAADTLEGIKLSFHPHQSRDIKWFHKTLNVQYEMNIFESDIDFIFEDGATKTKLKHNASSLLRTLFIDNIKSRCSSVYTEKQQSSKVDTLFGDMAMSYLLKDRSRPDIIRVPDLANAIITNLKNPVTGTAKNCADIYFSCSLIFPSRDGTIDGLDMDKIYRTAQSIPRPATTSEADHLQAMTAAFENLCALHAKNTAADGTINYTDTDIPAEVRDRCLLHNNHHNRFICDSDLKRFNNKLTMNLAKTQQDLKFVEYPEVGQTHLILMNGTVYSYLQYQSLKQRTAFVSSAMTMDEWTPREWFRYHKMLEISAAINRVFVFPYYCQYRNSPAPYGFVCDDPEVNSDADLPIKYESLIDRFSLIVMQYLLNSSLPKEATNILNSCENDGYKALYSIHLTLHPKLIRYPIDVCYAAPRQGIDDSVSLYFCQVRFHRQMIAYILDSATDSDHKYAQDILIANMYYASEIRRQVEIEQHCNSEDVRNQYKGALFEHTIARIDAIIRRNHHHDTTQGRNEQLAINSMGKLDHQSHTTRLVQHTSRLETLERQLRTLTAAIHDNNVGGHSVHGATVQNDVNDRLVDLEVKVFKLNNTINGYFDNKNNDNNRIDKLTELTELTGMVDKLHKAAVQTNKKLDQQQKRRKSPSHTSNIDRRQQQQYDTNIGQRQQQQQSPSHPSNNNCVNSSNNTYVTNNLISPLHFDESRVADPRKGRRLKDFIRGVRN